MLVFEEERHNAKLEEVLRTINKSQSIYKICYTNNGSKNKQSTYVREARSVKARSFGRRGILC